MNRQIVKREVIGWARLVLLIVLIFGVPAALVLFAAWAKGAR